LLLLAVLVGAVGGVLNDVVVGVDVVGVVGIVHVVNAVTVMVVFVVLVSSMLLVL
jgi:hypothetical protein